MMMTILGTRVQHKMTNLMTREGGGEGGVKKMTVYYPLFLELGVNPQLR